MEIATVISIIDNLVSNLIFPLFIAVLGTQIWNFILERKKKEAEREEKLYGPLRFYLMLIKNNEEIRKKLRENMRNESRKIKDDFTLFTNRNVRFSEEVAAPLIKQWWFYVNQINNFLERFSGLIRKNDWPLVEDFASGLFLREAVTGKERYKDTAILFSDDMENEGREKIQYAIKALQNKILNNPKISRSS